MNWQKLHLFSLFLAVLLLSFILYSPFLRFDLVNEQPWRQTDSQGIITAYAKNWTPFIRPMVNAPQTHWGPGVIEVGFPLYQYVTGKLVNLLIPLIQPFITSSQNNLIQLPYGMRLANFSQSHITQKNKIIFTLHFNLKPTFEYWWAAFHFHSLPKLLHLYLVAKKPQSRQHCIGIQVLSDIHPNAQINFPLPYQYCYRNTNVPILYLPISDYDNVIKFTFNKTNAPEKLENTIKIFSDSKYASPELFTGRLVNIITIAAIAWLLATTFFPRGWFQLLTALSICVIPIFGLFASFIHEEIQTFFFISLFLYLIFKKGLKTKWILLAACSLSIAVAMRIFYILYSLMLAALAIYQEKIRAFKRPVYYLSAIITILPATLWYSWSQYMVRHGADTTAIFNNRVFFKSLLSMQKWQAFMHFFITVHFNTLIFTIFTVLFILFIILRVCKIIHFNAKHDIFLSIGCLISLIVLPFIFDTAVIHDYYSFIISSFFTLAAFISLYRIANAIQSSRWRWTFLIIIFTTIFSSGIHSNYIRFAQSVKTEYDPSDYAVWGSVISQIFHHQDKAVLLDAGGPEIYGMTNRFGLRDAGFYSGYPFKGVQDFTRYLTKRYGAINTYAGIASCKTVLHRLQNYNIYKQFLRVENKKKPTILYTIPTYPYCIIAKFS